MRSTMELLLPALAFVAMMGAATPDTSQSSDPPGKLGMWEGRWSYSGHIYETAYSHAHSDSGTVDCNWMPSRGYMVCDYISNDPPHNDLSVFSYSSVAKAYTHVEITQDAKPSWAKVTQSGNTWITSSELPSKGKTLVLRDVFVFLSPIKQTTTVQVSADRGQSWITLIKITAAKIGA
jgi:hypothetical protein